MAAGKRMGGLRGRGRGRNTKRRGARLQHQDSSPATDATGGADAATAAGWERDAEGVSYRTGKGRGRGGRRRRR